MLDRQLLKFAIALQLKSMEQGTFQTFCNDFIPLIHERYKGIHRHGATASGKTRAGTPDSIKTFTDGTQLSIQASTEEKYWVKPESEEGLPKWKPIADLIKCSSALNDPKEIVLCCNQEIPTNLPNVESDIYLYAPKVTKSEVYIYSLPDLEEEVVEFFSSNYNHGIIKTYFPQIHSLIQTEITSAKTKTLVETYRTTPTDFSEMATIADGIFDKAPNVEVAKKLFKKGIVELKERFEIKPVPPKSDVVREIPADSPLLYPTGKFLSLIGVVKIGKSYLIAQCAGGWVKNGLKVKWFRCPVEEEQKSKFCSDITRNILTCPH